MAVLWYAGRNTLLVRVMVMVRVPCWRAVILLSIGVLYVTGCTSFSSLVQTLNERQLASCIKWQGSMSAGAGMGASGAVQAMTVTGGMTIGDCLKAKDGGLL